MVHEVFYIRDSSEIPHSYYIYVDDIRKYNYNRGLGRCSVRGYIWFQGKLAFSKKISDKSLQCILNNLKKLKIEKHIFVSFSNVDPKKRFSSNEKFDAWVKQLYKKYEHEK